MPLMHKINKIIKQKVRSNLNKENYIKEKFSQLFVLNNVKYRSMDYGHEERVGGKIKKKNDTNTFCGRINFSPLKGLSLHGDREEGAKE